MIENQNLLHHLNAVSGLAESQAQTEQCSLSELFTGYKADTRISSEPASAAPASALAPTPSLAGAAALTELKTRPNSVPTQSESQTARRLQPTAHTQNAVATATQPPIKSTKSVQQSKTAQPMYVLHLSYGRALRARSFH
jgi:hypothetical protein